MVDIDNLLEEAMIFEAETGKMAVVKMKTEFFNKLHRKNVRYLKAEGYIAGLPYHTDDDMTEDYVIYGIQNESFMR